MVLVNRVASQATLAKLPSCSFVARNAWRDHVSGRRAISPALVALAQWSMCRPFLAGAAQSGILFLPPATTTGTAAACAFGCADQRTLFLILDEAEFSASGVADRSSDQVEETQFGRTARRTAGRKQQTAQAVPQLLTDRTKKKGKRTRTVPAARIFNSSSTGSRSYAVPAKVRLAARQLAGGLLLALLLARRWMFSSLRGPLAVQSFLSGNNSGFIWSAGELVHFSRPSYALLSARVLVSFSFLFYFFLSSSLSFERALGLSSFRPLSSPLVPPMDFGCRSTATL